MLKLAIRIQHVKGKRERWTKTLLSLLGKDSRIEVIENEPSTCWEGGKRTLLSYLPSDTHVLCLQDDILPCVDFIPTVETIIKLLPNETITFFTPRELAQFAIQKQIQWLKLRVFFNAQAFVMPVDTIRRLIEWDKLNVKSELKNDDEHYATFFYYNNQYVYATNPSLVEHIGWNETTLNSYNKDFTFEPRLRMASNYIGFENSGLFIDWRKGLDNPIMDNEGCNSMFCSNLRG